MRLDEIRVGSVVKGVVANHSITVDAIKWHGSQCLTLTFRDDGGKPDSRLCYADEAADFQEVAAGRRWSFDGDGNLLRLVSEARRIQLAHLFDPHLAVHTSLVSPLPHQISAVYEHMLPRQPLRYLLADDPGSGKTIMAGLLIRELLIRGDLKRCLIVCPGSLVEQWQDELGSRFQLPFEILTNDRIEASRTRNPFNEINLMIARLDKLSRDEDAQLKLAQSDWDLIVCDESHKMSAAFFGGEVKETKRYKLGKLLGGITRNFLLMTATPHNGKEEDFQLFMALLDGDRFEGKFRDGVHASDVTDLMRRMVKEQLVTFEGKPLFPERCAYTVPYPLSDDEARLYVEVTDYVRTQFNRAENLTEGRRGTIGFALTVLQRRLASSPEAIFQSLKRRKERLEGRLREEELLKRGRAIPNARPNIDLDDLDDAPDAEVEEIEEELVDSATASQTIPELRIEIDVLIDLENLAHKVRTSGRDRKWEELSSLLQNNAEMFDAHGHRRKLIIFTEHRDTLNYLLHRIRTLLGKADAVLAIHGGMGREQRKRSEEAFKQDKEVFILVATDAAGEGINLQRAHLMVNYDLPWNPNRIEQRFGRIHRIGQTEVCHLWNLVAEGTREGDVYLTLLRKLEVERVALGGSVFDVLGKAIDGTELRQLLIEAIRYGDREDVRDKLHQIVEGKLNRGHLQDLIEDRALADHSMDTSQVRRIREDMERIEAQRLQPHFIASFFMEAFKHYGGSIREREPARYEITNVPAIIRGRDRQIGVGAAILQRYERVCFEKELINVPGKPSAAFVCPGNPLLESVSDVVLERHRDLLKQGATLVNDADKGEAIRVLFYLEHAVADGRSDAANNRRVISRRMQFVEIDGEGNTRSCGPAPYLDYRPISDEEKSSLKQQLEAPWLSQDLERSTIEYAITHLAVDHLREIKERKIDRIDKIEKAVTERLTKEITYWDHRASQLRELELAGHPNARLNSDKARSRADDLQMRLQNRMAELAQERQIVAQPPIVVGGALVIPGGLLARAKGERAEPPNIFTRETRRVELAAMEAVRLAEVGLGFEPRDVSAQKIGYDIESRNPETGRLRFIEVKGRFSGATIVTLTKNEILTAFNKPDDYILALVEVPFASSGENTPVASSAPDLNLETISGCNVRYVRRPFKREPDFGATSVNYELVELVSKSNIPS
jgi:superfamily II DNA or RNA helicase